MRKLIYAINLTIDGCCDHTKVTANDAMLEYFTGLTHEMGLLLFGRITYELMVPYWPDIARNPAGQTQADIDYAKAFDSMDKIVFSRSLDKVEDDKTRIVRKDPRDEILRLKQGPGGNMLIGGVGLSSELIRLGLVDEYYFVVHPVIAGEGRRLLEGVALPERLALRLVDSKIVGPGSAALHYLAHG